MTQPTQTQQLQNDVLILKSRVFDVQELLAAKQEELNQYASLVKEIIGILGIHDSGEGVTPQSIIEGVKALLPHPSLGEVVDVEPEVLLTE
ncbi:chaperone for tail fiber formation [Pectobacterium phage POP12]|nr:chaperone for tail fiber formation [Pectobacterium phage POP12]